MTDSATHGAVVELENHNVNGLSEGDGRAGRAGVVSWDVRIFIDGKIVADRSVVRFQFAVQRWIEVAVVQDGAAACQLSHCNGNTSSIHSSPEVPDTVIGESTTVS